MSVSAGSRLLLVKDQNMKVVQDNVVQDNVVQTAQTMQLLIQVVRHLAVATFGYIMVKNNNWQNIGSSIGNVRICCIFMRIFKCLVCYDK